MDLEGKTCPSVVFVDGRPGGESGNLAFDDLSEAGVDDVGNAACFEEAELGVFKKSGIGPPGAQFPMGGHEREGFCQECGRPAGAAAVATAQPGGQDERGLCSPPSLKLMPSPTYWPRPSPPPSRHSFLFRELPIHHDKGYTQFLNQPVQTLGIQWYQLFTMHE